MANEQFMCKGNTLQNITFELSLQNKAAIFQLKITTQDYLWFQVSIAIEMRSSFFCDITQRSGNFLPTFRDNL